MRPSFLRMGFILNFGEQKKFKKKGEKIMKNGKNMLLLVFASFIGFQIEATRNEETVLQTMREYITIPDSYYLELLKLADAKQRD